MTRTAEREGAAMKTVSETAPLHPTVARLIVRCLENEGVEYVFGIPGEENIGA